MDISFQTGAEKFNYRVCAVMICDGKILAMQDERSAYYYLPGGRVKMGETAEEALMREVREELHITADILRPLWLNQAFFTEDVDKLRYHELCVYFLVDGANAQLHARGDRFTLREAEHVHTFEWLALERLSDEYFYPLFLKKEIFHLPETFTLRTEIE